METLPAIVIGGPPHSGKSVLLYSLSHALRAAGVEHYALRACPDGEGDWANEADAPLVRTIRIDTKGEWTVDWVDRMCQDIAVRHLPLLVDIGGKPTLDQERIFDECTHAVLLTKDADSRAEWLERVERHGTPLLAGLTSDLHGTHHLAATSPQLTGTIAGLERGSEASGPVFDALVRQVADVFSQGDTDYRSRHLALAPAETALDLDRLAVTLALVEPGEAPFWQPEQLPEILDYLPGGVELAAYGRGTNWLQAALACLAYPANFFNFDVRLGWVQAQRLPVGDLPPNTGVRFRQSIAPGAVHLETLLPRNYLDYSQLSKLALPFIPSQSGVILSGQLPYWLYTSLAVSVHDAPWIAVYQPRLKAAVVVHARDPLRIGSTMPVPST